MQTMYEFQYIEDSLLIERIAQLSDFDNALYKEASVVGDLFSGVQSTVSSFVKSNVDTSSTGSLLKSVLNLLAPGMFFKASPLLGVIYTAGSMFGFDAASILSSIVNVIKPKIMAGEQVTPQEVNQAGAQVAGTTVEASFNELRELEKKGEIVKSAQKTQPLGGSMFGTKGAPLLYRLFGFLGQKRSGAGKSLAVGFIVWFIKTILLGSGLLAISGAAKNLLTEDKDNLESGTVPNQESVPGYQQANNSKEDTARYVPIKHSPSTSLMQWAQTFYPELSGYEDIIEETPAFKAVVQRLSAGYQPGKTLAKLPAGMQEKDLVQLFINDARAKIKDQNENQGI